MEYNSQKDDLVMPEYGRNVQLLVQYAKHIEDKEYRQAFIERIVQLMYQMNPQSKNVEDYKIKLWSHVFHIAEYDIDVLPPDGEIPEPEQFRKKPDKVNYPALAARFRHYGGNVQNLIRKALSMEKGPKRDAFVSVIGSYMKLAYRTWNKEHYVSDEVIKNDLVLLSNGELELKDSLELDNLTYVPPSNNNHRRGGRQKHHSNNYSNNNGRGGRGGRHNNGGRGGKKYYRK